MTFNATSLENGKYESLINLPSTLSEGSHPFKIEVLLNGRLFTPISTKIDVRGKEPAVQEAKPEAKVKVQPKIETTNEVKQAPKKSEKKKLTRLESVVHAPVQKLKPRKPAVSESKIKIADIANEAADREVPSAAVQRQTIAVEHVVSIPLTLTKGEIIFK